MGKTPAERVRNAIRYNTSRMQPDTIADHHVRTILIGNGTMTIAEYEAGVEEALDKEWIEQVTENGTVRYRPG